MAKKRYTHKQIRKSIKQDELRDVLNRIFTFSKKNTENILISVIIFIVILVLVPLYFNNQEKNEERAGGLFNRAVNYSLQPLAEGLADPDSGAFRTREEKYEKVRQSFAEISGTYRNTKVARMAKVGEANALFYLIEYEKAMALYQEAGLKESDSQIKLTLDERIAACYENMKQWDTALAAYQAILKENSGYFNKRDVHIHMARCYRQLGRKEQAEKLLQEELAEEPGSYWSEIARQQLVRDEKSVK